jgi:Ethanolamine utilization protein EutJ (predicted chaperonin)
MQKCLYCCLKRLILSIVLSKEQGAAFSASQQVAAPGTSQADRLSVQGCLRPVSLVVNHPIDKPTARADV